MTTIEISSIQSEGPYLVSKFHKLFFLLSKEELKNLFSEVHFTIHPLGGIIESNQVEISQNELIELDLEKRKKSSSFILTMNKNTLYLAKINDKEMLKIRKPVLFLKPLYFTVSEGKVCETFGRDALFWGWSLSYPQIYQDPKTNEFKKVDDEFENTFLWKYFRKKLRDLSKVIAFEKEGKKIPSPYRLGNHFDKKLDQLEVAGIKLWEGK